MVIAFGVIINTALATWLTNRRLQADKRENGAQRAHLNRCPIGREVDQDEREKMGHPPGIDP